MKFMLFAGLFFFFSTITSAQNYCVKFSKEGKNTTLIKEGKNISFIYSNTETWKKGELIKITSDSLFLEQSKRGSKYNAKGYELNDFRIIAYNNTAKAVGKGSTAIFYIAMMAVNVSNVWNYGFNDKEKANHKKKFFKKNVDFDEGWSAEIVLCE